MNDNMQLAAEPSEAAGRTDRRQEFVFGIWRYDIDLAQDLIAASPRATRLIDVPQLASMFSLGIIRVDEAYARSADLAVPLIVAPLPDEGHLVIDGWHRIWRALQEGVATLPAYLLTAEETKAVRPGPFTVALPPMTPHGAHLVLVEVGGVGTKSSVIHRRWDGDARLYCGHPSAGSRAVTDQDLAGAATICAPCHEVAWVIQLHRENTDPPPYLLFRWTHDPVPVMVCPHCSAKDTLAEEDGANRINRIDLDLDHDHDVDHGANPTGSRPAAVDLVGVVIEGERHFETIRYCCTACSRSVRVPDDITISW